MEKEEFIRKTLHFAHEQHMWQNGDHILIAESGGPDSLALLLFLKSVAREEQLTLGACCVNHHLRPEAEAETEFVAKVCAEQGIACYIRQAYVTEVSEQTGESMETAGRRLRYEAFEEICRNEGYNLVATAHHANDQAETVLYHLIRGAGLMGLTGIHPRRGTRIRPFLWATKKQIGEFVSHFPYEPCHDITNDMAITARNHIRLELLPELAGYNPSIVQALSRTAEILREDEEAMEQMAEKMAEGCVTSDAAGMPAILVPQFRNCHLAFRRRIVRLVMQKVLDWHDQGGRTIGYDGIEKV